MTVLFVYSIVGLGLFAIIFLVLACIIPSRRLEFFLLALILLADLLVASILTRFILQLLFSSAMIFIVAIHFVIWIALDSLRTSLVF